MSIWTLHVQDLGVPSGASEQGAVLESADCTWLQALQRDPCPPLQLPPKWACQLCHWAHRHLLSAYN